MSTATKGHTVQSASQTKQDLNRNTKSDDETESVYSSTFARTRLLTTVFRESDNYSTNGTTVNYSTILLPIKDDTDAIHSKGFKQKSKDLNLSKHLSTFNFKVYKHVFKTEDAA